MARIKFGSIVSDIAGSIGGHTFQKNSYGFSIRSKPIATKNRSLRQSSNSNIMLKTVQEWSLLTNDQRMSYDRFLNFSPDFAWLNSKSLLSGYNLFVKWVNYLLRSQLSIPSNITFIPITLPTFSPILAILAGDLVINVEQSENNSDLYYQLRLSAPVKYSNDITSKGLKVIIFHNVSGSGININSAYVSNFGFTPVAGDIIKIGITLFHSLEPIIFNEQVFTTTVFNA